MKKSAFTLAEVLITLGIIGVVAAMTIPTLIAKHNRQVTANRLAKAYSTISNGIKLSENDNGPMVDWPMGAQMSMDEYWNTYWKPYFVGAELCKNADACGFPKSLDGGKWTGTGDWVLGSSNTRILFRIADGTIIFLPRNTNDSEGNLVYVSTLWMDINGSRLPNESGKDVFMFTRNTDAGIKPATKSGQDCYKNKSYCAELIMQNGWKIPDDYPWLK